MKETVSEKPKIMTPFTLYHQRKSITTTTDNQIRPIIRLCSRNDQVFLLDKSFNLYRGYLPKDSTTISLTIWKSNIVDIDLWDKQLYIVQQDGIVIVANIDDNTIKKIDFNDELQQQQQQENNDEIINNHRVFIRRVKCNSIGNLFISSDNIVYGSGDCGDVLTTKNPTILKCFEGKRVVDFSAGLDFFIILTCNEEFADEDDELCNRSTTSSSSSSKCTTDVNERKLKIFQPKNLNAFKRIDTVEVDIDNDDNHKNEKLNSNDSLLSKCDDVNNDGYCDNNIDSNIKQILRDGHNLSTTGVFSFGASNNGVLGTGDHIKRHGLNCVLSLIAIGVTSISSGKEHSIARTIDGRVFHWGLNNDNQINTDKDKATNFSSPKEFDLNNLNSDETDLLLEACCGNYNTVILLSNLRLYENGKLNFDRKFNEMHSSKSTTSTTTQIKSTDNYFPLILISNDFLLQNHKIFSENYKTFFNSMQITLRQCIKNKYCVTFVKYVQNTGQKQLQYTSSLCQGYLQILYTLTLCLKSVEDFYNDDITIDQLLFIKNSKEMIKIYEKYSKSFYDIKSISGFDDITKIVDFINIGEHDDYEKIFSIPLQQITNIIQFIEQLIKLNPSEKDYLHDIYQEWQNFAIQNRINMELSENTENFWIKHDKNLQLKPFKKKHRRVILDSTNIPLKLNQGGKFTSNYFILFSDCLLQYGSQLQIYPLSAMWVKIVGETSIKIITPEKLFILNALTHEEKMLWFDQFESTIRMVLNRPIGEKISNVRTTGYTFSEKHAKYPDVRCFGRWRIGVMHGTCYLEYPDGKIYYGDMFNGEIEGYGKMILPSIGFYEGNFIGGKFHGHGMYEMKDNEKYDGNFKDGLFHGHGVLSTNTYTYVGEFLSNAKSGYGVLDDNITGDKYMGMFVDNKPNGVGICITMSGDYFAGFFINGNLSSEGVAMLESGYYYEGEMTITGPSGKGSYFMPYSEIEEEPGADVDIVHVMGNVITGDLGGTWSDIKVHNGSVLMHQKFPKYPKTINEIAVSNDRKWRALFDNWETEVFGSTIVKNTKQIWNRIAIYITNQKDKERLKENDFIHPGSYFARNITLQYDYVDLSLKFSSSLDKISFKSVTSLNSKRYPLPPIDSQRKSYSNETLYDRDSVLNATLSNGFDGGLISFLNGKTLNGDSPQTSQRSSIESNAGFQRGISTLDYIPQYGVDALNENDFKALKEYLTLAFKDPIHPLYILNDRILNCFNTSYGCWKVKPTPIISTQGMREWESISTRVYGIIRMMFPALPPTYCTLEESKEIVSHISLLYPIILSEGIYSTLFVLYANKYSQKDELYRQKILRIEKKNNKELLDLLHLESSVLSIVEHPSFNEAITTFKQVTEKYYPGEMLSLIETSMNLIGEAHKNSSDKTVIIGADDMMPLTIFLILRAAVQHLGAELALLSELTGGSSYGCEMSGLAAYYYTTVKAAYEHIISGKLESS